MKVKRPHWIEMRGGSSLCGFLAGSGVGGGQFKTVEEMLLAVAEIFQVPLESDCAKMSESIKALGPAKRRSLRTEYYLKHNGHKETKHHHPANKRLDRYIKKTEKRRVHIENRRERLGVVKPKPLAPAQPTQDQITEFYASWEWKQLSFATKVERGRQCECCGAKPPAVVIHTDHVKPLRHFWHLRLAKDNMQILCEDCNRGKGSWNQTDFRAELTTPPFAWAEAEVKVEWGDTWDDIPLKGYPN